MASSTPVRQELESKSSAARDTAIGLLAPSNLHQCLWLPRTDNHDRLRVTFATTSNFDNHSLPAVLFAGPMFGTRYNVRIFDKVARESGVRVICVDRPGIGGASPVPLSQRMSVWLETVPALLHHLNVDHISVLSHSAGTMYALNTISNLRHVLHPTSPYVALLGPFVANEHSNVTLINIASSLPNAFWDGWAGLQQFINGRVMPVSSWSGGVLSSISGLFQAPPGDSGQSSSQEMYGVDEETEKQVEKLVFQYMSAEGLTGANEEARLCVKKGPAGLWGACEDYQDFAKNQASKELAKSSQGQGASKLRIRIHYAESDMMSGKDGQEYFDKCWQHADVADAIDVESKEWPGTNHETVLLDLEKGAVRPVLRDIARLCS